MITTGRARFLVVTNNEGERYGSTIKYEANPGKTEYIKRLREINVPFGKIAIPEKEAFHARQENTAFIDLAIRERWSTAAILTQPHQALRTMLGAVQEMSQTKYWMRLYTITPGSTPWEEIVKGSQGQEEKARFEHAQDELERIIDYQSTGELATFEELFTYYQARVRGFLRLQQDLPPEFQGGLPA